ncbi:uncharacterized protein CDAR_23191 [Caerostris darwini]|uniref:Inner centromere protein ARK-binding domain-containing protein n=1 Tax=Caerostris darwini TaxID=1538125 RepID=A0AAV4QF63_9ARAC|nr:uncharacterized protein CDAR_23191 [Caerostris darwini]
MSTSCKITDDEMRYFQFKAKQLFLLRKEDHEWNEFCKKKTCTCCSCQVNVVPKTNKEVGIQSSPKQTLSSSEKNRNFSQPPANRNLPQALNEIKAKLERIDLALSDMKEPAKEINISQQQTRTLKFPQVPVDSDAAESVKSFINNKRMQLIQNSLRMSLQRLQRSAAIRNVNPISDVKIKKKSSGYFIPRELEKQRAAARRAYLASLEKTAKKPVLPVTVKERINDKKGKLKQELPKTVTKKKTNVIVNKDEQKNTLVASEEFADNKDENIENAVDDIIDDLMGETVIVVNKIKKLKNEKFSTALKSIEVINDTEPKTVLISSETKNSEHSKWETIRQNLNTIKAQSEQRQINNIKQEVSKERTIVDMHNIDYDNTKSKWIMEERELILKKLEMDPNVAKRISNFKKDYWSYLERISRTKKGNFNPWSLSNLIAESLLDDCIHEISQELQDVPDSLITDIYNQEFLQSV